MRKRTIHLFVLGTAIAVLAFAGIIVPAQNSNSSTTMANTNTTSMKPKPRRHRRKAKMTEAAADTGTMTESSTSTPRRTGRCDPTQQEQTDLSGTYTGKLKHGDEAMTDATLTVTGNNFTASMGTDSHTGRITAVTTCGYTAVTMMPEGSPRAMSLRAKKVGDSLTLMSVPGEPEKVMFTSGGSAMRPRRHKARPKTKTAAPSTPTTPPEL